MEKHCDEKNVDWVKSISIISPLAIIAGSIYAYGALDATVKTSSKRIDTVEQAVIEIKKEFSEAKNEMTKTQGQVAQVQQKVDLVEKNLVKQIDSVEEKVANTSKELRADIKEQNSQIMRLLVELKDGTHKKRN